MFYEFLSLIKIKNNNKIIEIIYIIISFFKMKFMLKNKILIKIYIYIILKYIKLYLTRFERSSWNSKVYKCPVGKIERAIECENEPLPVPLVIY